MALEIPFVQIEWSQQMATGVVQVDVQHRYLVDMLREANARLLGDHDAERLAEVAKGLLN